MRELQITLLIILSLTGFTDKSFAQNKPLACQVDRASGLDWDNGRWVSKNFERRKFFLVQQDNTLTIDSVAKVIGVNSNALTCNSNKQDTFCTLALGVSFFFSTETLNGGMSYLGGSVSGDQKYRDSVAVQVFTCTQF